MVLRLGAEALGNPDGLTERPYSLDGAVFVAARHPRDTTVACLRQLMLREVPVVTPQVSVL